MNIFSDQTETTFAFTSHLSKYQIYYGEHNRPRRRRHRLTLHSLSRVPSFLPLAVASAPSSAPSQMYVLFTPASPQPLFTPAPSPTGVYYHRKRHHTSDRHHLQLYCGYTLLSLLWISKTQSWYAAYGHAAHGAHGSTLLSGSPLLCTRVRIDLCVVICLPTPYLLDIPFCFILCLM